MTDRKTDIVDRKDVTEIINKFYQKVRQDKLLAPIFSKVDWEHHTPVIIDFWCMVLFGDQQYRDNPFQKHAALPIQREHFGQWLALFSQTIDENFTGEKADEAKQRAHSIAQMFQFKMGLLGR